MVIDSDHSIQKMTNDKIYKREMIHKCYNGQNGSSRGIKIVDKNTFLPILIPIDTDIPSEVFGINKYIHVYVVVIIYYFGNGNDTMDLKQR